MYLTEAVVFWLKRARQILWYVSHHPASPADARTFTCLARMTCSATVKELHGLAGRSANQSDRNDCELFFTGGSGIARNRCSIRQALMIGHALGKSTMRRYLIPILCQALSQARNTCTIVIVSDKLKSMMFARRDEKSNLVQKPMCPMAIMQTSCASNEG